MKRISLVLSLLITSSAFGQGYFDTRDYAVTAKVFVPIEGMSDVCLNPRRDCLVAIGDMKDIAEIDYAGNILRRVKVGLLDCEAIQWMSGDESGDWYAIYREPGKIYWLFIAENLWAVPPAAPATIDLNIVQQYSIGVGDRECVYTQDGVNWDVMAFRKNGTSPALVRVIRDGFNPPHHVVEPSYTMSDLVEVDNYSVRSTCVKPELSPHVFRLHHDSNQRFRIQEFNNTTGQVVSQSDVLLLSKGEGVVFRDESVAYAVADKTGLTTSS
jgi:hypothetical protein